jgi:hypothetical protein
MVFLQRCEERDLVPVAAWPWRALLGTSLLRLADDLGHQRLEALAHELFDLYGHHLCLAHLRIEELDDAAQLRGDGVGDEHEPHLASTQVGVGAFPEILRVDVDTQAVLDFRLAVQAIRLAALLELLGQGLHRSVGVRVRRVVEHLGDDLAADARVSRTLDLDEGRHTVLVEEEVVEGELPAATPFDRDRGLP